MNPSFKYILMFTIFMQFQLYSQKVGVKTKESQISEQQQDEQRKSKVDLFDPPEFKKFNTPQKNTKPVKTAKVEQDLPDFSLKAKVIVNNKLALAVIKVESKEFFVQNQGRFQLQNRKQTLNFIIKNISDYGVEIYNPENSVSLWIN